MRDKVIFLDVDGVLNSEKYHVALHQRILNKELSEDDLKFDHTLLAVDPQAVKLLNRITTETRAKIILSSTWRSGKNLVELRDLFNLWGITGACIGRTQDYRGRKRGYEIEEVLEHLSDRIDKWCIIDDDDDMLDNQQDHFFRTNWEVGLTEELTNKIINYLNS